MQITDLWQQLEAWLARNAPELRGALNPGATEAELAAAEAKLGVRLPDDARACYAVHNGQERDSPGLFHANEFLSLERILEEWGVWKDLLDHDDFEGIESEPSLGVKSDWWNAAWIPFTYNGAGDHLSIDLDPAEGGHRGQIIEMWHDTGERPRLAGSFGEWFGWYVAQVLAGEIVFSEDYNGLISKDDD